MDNILINVLLIEDSLSAVEMIKDMLLEAKYSTFNVKVANDLASGLDILSKNNIDAVLLDLGLPDSSGEDTFNATQKRAPMIPIVVLTSLEDEKVIMKMVQSGAQDYLIKVKVDSDMLERALRYAIERKSLEKEIRGAKDNLEIRVENRTRELAEVNRELTLAIEELDRLRELALDANPLTQLPGNNTISKSIQEAIDSGDSITVIYSDLDNFKTYNDKYGFSLGDLVLKFTADLLGESLHNVCNGEGFLGHIGGDDFVLLASSCDAEILADHIITAFDNKIRNFYTKEEYKNGYVEVRSRSGDIKKFPVISISLAGVELTKGRFNHYLQVSSCCAGVKCRAKECDKSVFYLDRRVGKFESDQSLPNRADQ
jgi:diguanylate cyclase (GGDEF)-like protein